MIPKECKRLAEVDFPIAVVSTARALVKAAHAPACRGARGAGREETPLVVDPFAGGFSDPARRSAAIPTPLPVSS